MSKALVREIWISKQEAMERYSISERQLERYTADGRVRKREMPRPDGRTRPPVFVNAADLAKLRQATPPRPSPAMPALLPAPAEAIEGDEQRYSPEPRRPPRQWMTIPEASRWSGLSERWLRIACETGKVRAIDQSFKKGRHMWRISRDGIAGAVDMGDESRTD
jgi:hypothetical protein